MSQKQLYSRVLQKNIKLSQLSARPNCLWIRTKEHLKREIIVNIIKKENVPLSSILGIAERKGNLVDITCKNREQAQLLQEKLSKNDAFKAVHLYQSETTLVNLSWVPIPMSHEDIKEELTKYGQVIKIIGRIDKDGLLTGRRAAIMKNDDLEKNPIPSYLWIKGEELYVTYKGQEITCKYCGEVGHKQADCQTKTKDYPQLLAAPGVPKANAETNKTPKHTEELQHLAQGSMTSTPVKNTKLISPQKHTSNKNASEVRIENVNMETLTQAGKRAIRSPLEVEGEPDPKSMSLCLEGFPVTCISCKKEGLTYECSNKFYCWSCKKEQRVVEPCCDENVRFVVDENCQLTNCVKCNQALRRMPCCKKFMPEQENKDNVFTCVECEEEAILCTCSECHKITLRLIDDKTPYNCECGMQHEVNLNLEEKIC
ncbi:uncharacterized protein LOC144744506 [Ciona intestinalis]